MCSKKMIAITMFNVKKKVSEWYPLPDACAFYKYFGIAKKIVYCDSLLALHVLRCKGCQIFKDTYDIIHVDTCSGFPRNQSLNWTNVCQYLRFTP